MAHKRVKPKFKLNQTVRIREQYTGKIVDKAWIAGGWCYKIKGGNWYGEESFTVYKKV